MTYFTGAVAGGAGVGRGTPLAQLRTRVSRCRGQQQKTGKYLRRQTNARAHVTSRITYKHVSVTI